MKPLTRKQELLAALAEGRVPNIKPLTAEEILLYKQAEREAASKNPKWEDIADKPFGETIGKGNVWFAETNVSSERYFNDGVGKHFYRMTTEYSPPKEGDRYIVVWDGKEYLVAAYADNGVNLKFGESILVDERKYPFFFNFYTEQYSDYVNIEWYDGAEHTVEVFKCDSDVTPIDSKYLPKMAKMDLLEGTVTANDFNALLTALMDAGYMAADSSL